MSILQILTIIRNHSGVHASDTVKITHKEVMTMIRAAHEDGRITMGARNLLIGAFWEFGGNEMHPDIFPSPADEAALKATIMQGIETAAKFARLGARSQLQFLKNVMPGALASVVGFTQAQVKVSDLPTPARKRVNAILKAEVVKAGRKFDPKPAWLNITALYRNGGTYGYMCTAGWLNNGKGGYWVADFYADQNGDNLMAQSDYEPPDDD